MSSLQNNVHDDVRDVALNTGQTEKGPSLGGRSVALIINWTPAVALMSTIFLLSSKPDFGGPAWVSALIRDLLGEGSLLQRVEWLLPYADAYAPWVAHFVEYGALAAAFYWAVRRQWPSIRRTALSAFGATMVYAISDELHQAFVPGRHPDPRDILTDAAGAALALLLALALERLLRTR